MLRNLRNKVKLHLKFNIIGKGTDGDIFVYKINIFAILLKGKQTSDCSLFKQTGENGLVLLFQQTSYTAGTTYLVGLKDIFIELKNIKFY